MYLLLHVMLQAFFIVRIVLRPHREPASRIAWIAVVCAIPIIGMITYILFGEVIVGRRRIERMRHALANLPEPSQVIGHPTALQRAVIPTRYRPLFRIAGTVNDFQPVGGNRGELLGGSDEVIDAIVVDIDAAVAEVHLSFFIWLADTNGLKVVEALKRAAGRGVTCRAMADDVGSHDMIESDHWKAMRNAGVHLARTLPVPPIPRPLKARIDLRNHRKIVIVDNRITYCGSQNCADAEFTIKAEFAPWVDAMIRFEGPVARQAQYLFASDWIMHTDEHIEGLPMDPMHEPEGEVTALAIGTGPTLHRAAMPEVFNALIYAAQHELVITTPYYVPDDALQAALCGSARRGVKTTLIFPAKNDNWIVGAASRSYYEELLEAGVRIYEYVGGLLHTKSLTLDGEVTLIGSANLDRRSFDLNFENNILFRDKTLTAALRQRQESYIAKSNEVTLEEVNAWSLRRQFWNNAVAMMGPLL